MSLARQARHDKKQSQYWTVFKYIVSCLRAGRARREIFRKMWLRTIEFFVGVDLNIPRLRATPQMLPIPQSAISLNTLRKLAGITFHLCFLSFESRAGTAFEGFFIS